jgi:nucleoside-diphosphate-sugar epimerase
VKALVTGGGGFLGAALATRLRAEGHRVRVLARGDYPSLRARGVETFRGDVRDPEAVARATAGVDVVFHAAALAAGAGPRREFEAINVAGTNHVIAACRATAAALVFTSSPSVVATGRDLEGADESLPYPRAYLADYPRTKAAAERLVRAADADGLPAVALRPHFIWGPGDRHLLPRLLDRQRAGRLKRVGARDPLTDTIYVDNCVDAHLLAADKLLAGAPLGDAYFVADAEPVGLWTMVDRLLAAAGEGPVRGRVPACLALAAGAWFEAAHRLFRREGEPVMTRFAAAQLSHAEWFDGSAARRDLGYVPRVSRDEGLERLAAWCRGEGAAIVGRAAGA